MLARPYTSWLLVGRNPETTNYDLGLPPATGFLGCLQRVVSPAIVFFRLVQFQQTEILVNGQILAAL